MAQPDDMDTSPPGKPTLAAVAAVLLGIGLVMLLHGLGLHGAGWLNPNPDTPQWVFAVIGAVLVLAALLTAGQMTRLPARLINTAGYAILGLSWLVTHWLVFFSVGGSCKAGAGGLLFSLPGLACRAGMGVVVIFFDLLLLLVLYATLRPGRAARRE